MSAATRLRSRHLLGIADLDPDEIELILDTAVAMKNNEYGQYLLRLLEEEAEAGGAVLTLFTSGEAPQRERSAIEA